MESLWLQCPDIQSYFWLLSGTDRGLSWTKETLPVLFGYSNRTIPYDIPFGKIRENILDLDYDLANLVLKFELRIQVINRMLTEATALYSSQSKTDYGEMLKDLEAEKNIYKAYSEFVRLLSFAASSVRKQLFEGKKRIIVDWTLADSKSNEIDKLLLKSAGIEEQMN
jgi:hypothetical protein